MAFSSVAAAAADRRSGPDGPGRDEEDGHKVRISQIGGRYLVFDVADVARLRRQHSMCAILVGITPQAPNQNVFSSLPLELTADEVRWLVCERRAAYVADERQAHLAALAQPAARRRYMESVRRQRQVAQAAADAVAAERERRGAEVRASMAAKRVQEKSKRATQKTGGAREREARAISRDTETGEQPTQRVVAAADTPEAPGAPGKKKEDVAVGLPRTAAGAAATDRADDSPADAEPLRPPPPQIEEALQREDVLLFGGPAGGDRTAAAAASAARDGQGLAVPLKQEDAPTREETGRKPPATALVRITPTTSAGLVGEEAGGAANIADGNAHLVLRASSSSLPASAFSAAALRAHLADRGYYTTPGLRFGGALSVYPGDPFRYHAHFVATSYGWDEPMDLLDVVSMGRLATGVKKGLLLGGAKPKPADDDGPADAAVVRTFTLEWAAI